MELLLAIIAIAFFSVLGSIFIRISWWFIKAIIGLIGFILILGFFMALF